MNNVIKFLEVLGSKPDYNRVGSEKFKSVVDNFEIGTEVKNAIVSKNTEELERLLGVRHKIVCMVNKPEPEEELRDSDSEIEFDKAV